MRRMILDCDREEIFLGIAEQLPMLPLMRQLPVGECCRRATMGV